LSQSTCLPNLPNLVGLQLFKLHRNLTALEFTNPNVPDLLFALPESLLYRNPLEVVHEFTNPSVPDLLPSPLQSVRYDFTSPSVPGLLLQLLYRIPTLDHEYTTLTNPGVPDHQGLQLSYSSPMVGQGYTTVTNPDVPDLLLRKPIIHIVGHEFTNATIFDLLLQLLYSNPTVGHEFMNATIPDHLLQLLYNYPTTGRESTNASIPNLLLQ
jgi:hypothetical protein